MENDYIRFYIKTRAILGVRAVTIYEELVTAYGHKVISYSSVQRLTKEFLVGRMEIEDQPRSGRPVSGTTEENIELVRSVVEANPHSTYDEIEVETELSRGTIFNIIHDHLKLRKITSRWVPHELTPQQNIQ